MENKDTNTEYWEVVRVGKQNWDIIEITTIFFLFEIRIIFQVTPEKSHPHLKCQFRPKIPVWLKSFLYKPSEKWLKHLPPLHHPGGGANYAETPHLDKVDPKNQNS